MSPFLPPIALINWDPMSPPPQAFTTRLTVSMGYVYISL